METTNSLVMKGVTDAATAAGREGDKSGWLAVSSFLPLVVVPRISGKWKRTRSLSLSPIERPPSRHSDYNNITPTPSSMGNPFRLEPASQPAERAAAPEEQFL